MNKAFIFDMDGVIIDSESVWVKYEPKFLPQLVGKNIYSKIKDKTIGSTVTKIYELAYRYGLEMDKNKFVSVYDSYAEIVYKEAKITAGVARFIENLIDINFKLAIVSSSRWRWIEATLAKMTKTANNFQYILSLNDEGIASKPSPQGYQKAMQALNAKPSSTIILEDSQRGIEAAKAAGAFVICLKENVANENVPKGADMYIETLKDLMKELDRIKL